MDDLVVLCADVGSVRSGRFGWACGIPGDDVLTDRSGSRPAELAAAVANALVERQPVALGFECPLFVPVSESDKLLGTALTGEGNRSWSAGAGTGALATGLVHMAWVLAEIRHVCSNASMHLGWDEFARAEGGRLIWEAFVTAAAKGASHVDDATIAVEAFLAALPDTRSASAISGERPLSLAGAAAVWSGWLNSSSALRTPTLVTRA